MDIVGVSVVLRRKENEAVVCVTERIFRYMTDPSPSLRPHIS